MSVSTKLAQAAFTWMSISDFQRRAKPPDLGLEGATRKWDSIFRGSSSLSTKASRFLVSWRKIISGESFLFRARSLRTVLGFPSPQQFHLSTPKEGGLRLPENPDEHQRKPDQTAEMYEVLVDYAD